MGGKGRLRDSWNRSQSDKAARGVSGVHTVQGPQQVTTVFEAGLYALIFSSRKETASKFQRWVFEEVLPSIRATGSYYQHRRPPSPEITAERRVNLVKTGLEIMDRLGGLDERDRMMFRDITRKLILDGAAETENETREVTVSEGWLEIFGTPFPRDQYRKIGMQLKAEYLAEFEGDPPKRIQYVDGAPRQVNSYNRRWLLAALRRLTTPAPQQLQAPVEGPE